MIKTRKNYSDLELFRTEINKISVFKSESFLDPNYVPLDELYFRKDAIKSLIFNFRRILSENGNTSINCVLLGSGGIGKTTIAKFFSHHFRILALENIKSNFYVEYINCTLYRNTTRIIRHLLKNICFNTTHCISDEIAWKNMISKLVRTKSYLFVVLDEVQNLSHNQILEILNISETFGHHNVRVSFLLISRVKDWMCIETEKILSKLNSKIVIDPYNYEQFYEILKMRCEMAFNKGVLDESILKKISNISFKCENLKHGITLLRTLGQKADILGLGKIIPSMISNSFETVYSKYRSDLDSLNNNELLVLYSILRVISSKDRDFTCSPEGYYEYTKVCKNLGLLANVLVTFSRHIRVLKKNHFLDSRREFIQGQKWFLKITSLIPPQLTKDLVLELELYIRRKILGGG